MYSFLWLSNILLYICTTTYLSIHLSMDSYVCFHILAIVNSVQHVFLMTVLFCSQVLNSLYPFDLSICHPPWQTRHPVDSELLKSVHSKLLH